MQRWMDYLEKPERAAMNTLVKTALCVMALTVAPPGHAEELGRLFFTPQQRALLESGQQPTLDKPENMDAMTINGIVQRHGGERTIWINGVPKHAGRSDERSPESAIIAIPGQSKKIKAKVGQKVVVNPDASKQ